jgi:hypothetical protein
MNDNPIDKMRRYITTKSQKAYASLEQCNTGIENLKKDILSWLRSDDPIADFTTVCYGAWSDDVTGPYRELVRNVSENLGREFLVVRCSVDDHGFKMSTMCGVAPSPTSYIKNWSLELGVVDGNMSFDNYNRSIMIPTKDYLITCGDEFALDGDPDSIYSSDSIMLADKSWILNRGPFIEKIEELDHLCTNRNLPPNIFASNENKRTSRILFGDYVSDFFSQKRDGNVLYPKGLELLSS